MPPLRDFDCSNCQVEFTDVLFFTNEAETCPLCGRSDTLQMHFSFPATYSITGDNSASVRPSKSRSTENKS